MKQHKPTIIDQLREALSSSDKTQAEIEQATGINQGNLSKFKRGVDKRQLSLEHAAKLAACLGLHLTPIKRK